MSQTSHEKSDNGVANAHLDEKASQSELSSKFPPEVNELSKGENTLSERRVVRKLDWHVLPLISLMHLLSFLDRSNFGNAKAANMEKSLHLQDLQFNIAAALFYVVYAGFEIPSNLLMKKIGPNLWFPAQMVAWGTVCALISLVKNYHGLLAVRIFLGLTEAGLFPGLIYYVSLWYTRREVGQRIAVFYASTTGSGAFGGILCWAIIKMDGVGGLAGWRWIFALEGIFTVLVGCYAFYGMYGLPEDAKFLNEDERALVLQRLKDDRSEMTTHYDVKFVKQALGDWKSYLYATSYIGTLIPVYALSLFLPSIIKNLGYSDANAQLLTTPPYLLAMIVAFFSARLSDRVSMRGPFVLATQTIAIIGFAVLIGTTKAKYGYLGTFLTCTGTYATIPVLLAWASNNTGGDTKKGVRFAIIIGIGNLGGICSSFVYRNQDRPRYHLGHSVMIAVLCMGWTATVFAMFTFNRLNKKKIEQCRVENITEDRSAEFREMGDDSPLFRFSL